MPLIFLLSALPSVLIGRPWKEALWIYAEQAKNYPSLSLNAPTLYQWLPKDSFSAVSGAGVLFAAAIIISLIFFVYKTKVAINKDQIIKISFLFLVSIPFFLPRMHERYFFPADVFSIVYAFYYPKYFFLPIAMQIISFLSYGPFLFGTSPNFEILSLGMLAIITATAASLFFELYPLKK